MTMWIESHNHVYGRTHNAYDPHRTAGGSSGGEGAAVGSGGSPVGLGSDIRGGVPRPPGFLTGGWPTTSPPPSPENRPIPPPPRGGAAGGTGRPPPARAR